ncbi:putative disease resistance protein RGA4 [Arachis duranensis]|uniref:Disease resistance protein RGA4 n=1 Tax=Arachis duranensis TaxID=130453 RepID=A0A6P5NKZ7_ARADU|nr:putative disease resistance protein RGA4 [Arachis duranensis]XP_052116793.1 putative disease resistance protein RGA4 [Arachis duranensis]
MQEMQLIYYNELPSWHLKQCFAYLSFIFPCEYPSVEENELTRLWMAEGFLGAVHVDSNSSSSSCSPQPQPEDLAHNCIQELGRRSILSVYTDKRDNMTECYLDNELISGLSRFVAGKDRFCMDDGNADVKETIPRVALTSKNFYVSNGTLSSLIENNKSLRTLLWDGQLSKFPNGVNLRFSACDAIFCAFKSLRVLKLRDLGIKILPVSIGELKSIRYLDLSRNNMKTLPSSIGKLKLLQTLKLSHCLQLRELPNEVKYLVSLRHLEIDECLHLSHLPATLKKLTKLETLSNFVVSTLNNHKRILGFKELVNLNNLSGQLEISHLERLKFVDGHHDAAAYLKEKQHLKRLILNWNHDNDHEDNKRDDERSLEQLEPHPNLQQLHIVGYSGVKYSSWLSSLNNLVDLSLNNCSKCESLPLEQFPKLKYLHLRRLDSLKYVIDQDDRCSWLEPEHLQYLSITDCPNLMSWWKGNTDNKALLFGAIKRMEIRYCPKLNSLPLFPNLDESLELEGSSVKPLLDTINYSGMASNSSSDWPLSRVKHLTIKNVEQHSLLPEDWLRNFVSLRYIHISERMSLIKGFKHLHSLSIMIIENCTLVDLSRDEWEGLQSLDLLILYQLAKLESLPKGIKHLTSLTYLDIETCPELKTLTEEIGHLKSLKTLCIIDCHKLASLPKGMINLKSLNWLLIRSCPLLLPRCQQGTGDDWPKIKHIKHIQLVGASEAYDQ